MRCSGESFQTASLLVRPSSLRYGDAVKHYNHWILAADMLCVSCNAAAAKGERAAPLPEYSIAYSENIVFEIDPRIELLAGTQS